MLWSSVNHFQGEIISVCTHVREIHKKKEKESMCRVSEYSFDFSRGSVGQNILHNPMAKISKADYSDAVEMLGPTGGKNN